MRERLVLAFVLLAIGVIALYGVPRAYSRAALVQQTEMQRLEVASKDVAALVAERRRSGRPVDAALLELGLSATDRIEYVAPDGRTLAVGAARDGSGGRHETRAVPGGGSVTARLSASTVAADLRSALWQLVVLGVVLAFAAALVGFVIARRLARPFQELARSAEQLGEGDFAITVPAYSVPEAEAIGSALRSAASQLDQLVRREREFAANASHQLRTPITALRLSLEDLTLWPETDPAVRAELERSLGELDRLGSAISELLDLARGRRIEAHQAVDLVTVARSAADRWARRLADESRTLLVEHVGRRSRTRVPRGPLDQVLDVLVDNARKHGRGTITVEVRDAGTHLELVVGDEGRSRLGPEVFRRGVTTGASGSEGIGLAVAAELAEVCGGHLSVDPRSETTRFVLWLPPRDADVSRPALPAS